MWRKKSCASGGIELCFLQHSVWRLARPTLVNWAEIQGCVLHSSVWETFWTQLYFKLVSDAAWSDAFLDLFPCSCVQGVAVSWCHAWLCFLIGTVMPLVVFRLSKNACCLNVVFSCGQEGTNTTRFKHTGFLFKQEDFCSVFRWAVLQEGSKSTSFLHWQSVASLSSSRLIDLLLHQLKWIP